MKSFIGILVSVLLVAASAQAQTVATPTNHFAWDQVGQSVATATGATYKIYVDAAAPVTATAVTCAVGAPTTTATCQADIPAMTPGPHTVTLTQNISGAESAKSTALSLTFVVVVTPTGLRIAS